MNSIRKKIEKAMYSEAKSRFISVELFLIIASAFYGLIVRIKNALYRLGIFKQKKLQCKVVSIGNIAVGGTGKTPMAIYLAEKLTMLGYKVAVISRGYRGRAEKKGGIVSNGIDIIMNAESSGDEPFMMAARLNNIPLVVGQNRHNAGVLAVQNFKPDIIILDDGFQHRKLFRDIDILLLDSKRPFGNGRLLPAGVLREPVFSIRRADAFIFTRSSSDNMAALKAIKVVSDKQPIFETYNTFYFFKTPGIAVSDPVAGLRQEVSENFSQFAGKKIVAFSGIAGNDNFRKTLSGYGCDIADFFDFPDHHRYSGYDIEKISKAITDKGAGLVMTTEKDFARMDGKFNFPVDIIVVGVKMYLKDEKSFIEFILNKL